VDEIFLLNLQDYSIKPLGPTYLATGSRDKFMFVSGHKLLSLGVDRDAFALVDMESGKTILPLPNVHNQWGSDQVSEIDATAISPEGRYFSFGTYDGHLQVWDLKTQSLISAFAGHPAIATNAYIFSIIRLNFSPQSNLLVSVGRDGTTRLWNIKTGTELRRLNVCCYADFTPDGRYLVTAGDGVIRVWGIPSP
jgi:WD40 repeat protein